MNVGAITIDRDVYRVEVTSDLKLKTTVGDVDVVADSRDQLAEKIRRERVRQKTPLAIAVVLDEGEQGFRRATLRGRNARTGAYLFTLADGSKVSLDFPECVRFGQDVTEGQLVELNRLRLAADAARAAEWSYLNKIPGQEPRHLWTVIEEAEKAAAR